MFKNTTIPPKFNYRYSDRIIACIDLKTSNLNWYKSYAFDKYGSIGQYNCYLDNNYIYLNVNSITSDGYISRPRLLKLDYSGDTIISKTFTGTVPSNRGLHVITKSKNNDILIRIGMTDTTYLDNIQFPVKRGLHKFAIVCMDSNLNYKWHWMLDCDNYGTNTDLVTDNDGNIFVSTHLFDTAYSGNSVFYADYISIFLNPIFKLDKNGKLIEIINIDVDQTLGYGYLNMDKYSNLYLYGSYANFNSQIPRSSIQFGDFRFQASSSTQNAGLFLAKYNSHKLQISNKSLWCPTDSLAADADTIYKFFRWVVDDTLTFWGKKINPKYNETDKHKVTLFGYERDSCMSRRTDTFKVYIPPVAKLDYFGIACRYNPAIFKDKSIIGLLPNLSSNIKVNYGDGIDTAINSSLFQLNNVQIKHAYIDTGIFKITYIVNYKNCSDTFVSSIRVIDAPKPGFELSEYSGCAPLRVKVKNTFVGMCDRILWEYDTSRLVQEDSLYQNKKIEFIFDKPGNYSVKQKLFAPSGCVSETTKTISVLDGFRGKDSLLINYVTVSNQDEITINWRKLNKAKEYEISDGTRSKFTRDTNLVVTNYYTSKNSYSFSVSGLDTCRNLIKSDISKTILLTGFSDTFNKFSVINWSPYEKWPNGVSEYSIEYFNNQSNVFESLSNSSSLNYTDNHFLELDNSLIEKCYRIVGHQSLGSNKSASNILCLKYQPTIFVPNSFSPNGDGLNDKFEIVSMGLTEIKVEIYNRWGVLLFETNNEKNYWDGTYQNTSVPIGGYIVLVNAKSNQGSYHYSGSINILR